MPGTHLSATTASSTRSLSSESDRALRTTRRAIWLLLILGGALEVLYLSLYVFELRRALPDDALLHMWKGLFFWLAPLRGYAVFLEGLLARVAWLNTANGSGNANAFLLFLCLAFLLVIGAAWAGRKMVAAVASTGDRAGSFFWIAMGFTALFALTMLWAPLCVHVESQDMLLSWLYGRMVVQYHVNPYVGVSANLAGDPAQQLLMAMPAGILVRPVASVGPVWIDVSILIAQAARESLVGALLGFRLVGLGTHLVCTLLLWSIVARTKPAWRLTALCLYAWNPLVLWLDISQVHPEILLTLFLLLALLFCQRDALILSWFFVLLAVLINLWCLLLLPLFLRFMLHKTRFWHWSLRLLWLMWLAVLSGIALVLAYLPFWQEWGISGVVLSIQAVFWRDVAINSLDAAILTLPGHPLVGMMWVLEPQHWMLLVLVVVGLFLLFALWLLDTFDALLLSCCWTLLLLITLQPVYWPWYIVVPLALVLCTGNGRMYILGLLLALGACISVYCWWIQPVWPGQGLVAVSVPFLLWGWIVFLHATWRMVGASPRVASRPSRPPRPHWFSRPSRPVRIRRGDLS